MKIESPLHAEHQLDQLAGQFEHWRQTRTHPGERFPQALWDQAVALAATLPPARVAKQLRLRLIDLKKQRATAPAAPQLELSRADGTRLCLPAPMSPLLLDTLVRAFVEGRSCCN